MTGLRLVVSAPKIHLCGRKYTKRSLELLFLTLRFWIKNQGPEPSDICLVDLEETRPAQMVLSKTSLWDLYDTWALGGMYMYVHCITKNIKICSMQYIFEISSWKPWESWRSACLKRIQVVNWIKKLTSALEKTVRKLQIQWNPHVSPLQKANNSGYNI